MTVRFGVPGAGRIGQVHARAPGSVPGARLVAVADPVAEAAERVAAAHGCTIRTIGAAAAADDIDAVVRTPTDTQADPVERVARGGRAVVCGTPVDPSLARVRACLTVVAETGTTPVVGFRRRFDPDVRAPRRAIDEGAAGGVGMVTHTSRDPGPPPPDDIRRSGGIFRDKSIHDSDVARWLPGEEVETVIAAASVLTDPGIGAAGDDDSANVILTTASGRQATIPNPRRAPHGHGRRIEVQGAAGAVAAGNHHLSRVVVANGAGDTRPPRPDVVMTRCAAAVAPAPATGEDGLRARAPTEAAIMSVAEGRAVRVAEVMGG